jgi:hypothetical protein
MSVIAAGELVLVRPRWTTTPGDTTDLSRFSAGKALSGSAGVGSLFRLVPDGTQAGREDDVEQGCLRDTLDPDSRQLRKHLAQRTGRPKALEVSQVALRERQALPRFNRLAESGSHALASESDAAS